MMIARAVKNQAIRYIKKFTRQTGINMHNFHIIPPVREMIMPVRIALGNEMGSPAARTLRRTTKPLTIARIDQMIIFNNIRPDFVLISFPRPNSRFSSTACPSVVSRDAKPEGGLPVSECSVCWTLLRFVRKAGGAPGRFSPIAGVGVAVWAGVPGWVGTACVGAKPGRTASPEGGGATDWVGTGGWEMPDVPTGVTAEVASAMTSVNCSFEILALITGYPMESGAAPAVRMVNTPAPSFFSYFTTETPSNFPHNP